MRRPRFVLGSFALGLLATACLACASPAFAEPAPPDTSLDAYLRRLADSTEQYYRGSTAGPDTAGLDSALSRFLADPSRDPAPRRKTLGLAPFLHFDRADGGVMGGSASIGRERGLGRIGGTLAWANGPDEWRGGGGWTKRFARPAVATAWTMRGWAGRKSTGFDRDAFDPTLSALRAFAFGNDWNDWVRLDGAEVSLEREAPRWRASAGYRDMLESSIPVSATWRAFGGRSDRTNNALATFGRAREVQLGGALRIPNSAATLEGNYWTSGQATGSDFTYRRLRLAAGGEFNLTRHVVLAPQLEYGRLRGQPVPQSAFFMGGRSSLRSLDDGALTGTGKALGRVELVMADDLAALTGIEALAQQAIHFGAFAASGALWGRSDPGAIAPYAGIPLATPRDFARAHEWLSEVGVSVMWRPGLPDPNAFVKAEYAIPIGPDARERRWQLSYQRTLNLLRPFE